MKKKQHLSIIHFIYMYSGYMNEYVCVGSALTMDKIAQSHKN